MISGIDSNVLNARDGANLFASSRSLSALLPFKLFSVLERVKSDFIFILHVQLVPLHQGDSDHGAKWQALQRGGAPC